MTQGKYVSENAQTLINRATQILGESPILLDIKTSTHVDKNTTIMSLAPVCNSIKVRNIVTVVESSIVICTTNVPTDCPTIQACPPSVSPNDYVNIVARVYAQAPQNGLTIVFDYVLDDMPMTTPPIPFDITIGGPSGEVKVYAFPSNAKYSTGQSLVLHGARQV